MKKPAFSMITAIIFIVIISVVGVSTIQTSQKTLSFAKRTYIKEQAEILFDYIENIYRYSNFYAMNQDYAIDVIEKCEQKSSAYDKVLFYIQNPDVIKAGDVYGGNTVYLNKDDTLATKQPDTMRKIFFKNLATNYSDDKSIYKITVKQIPINDRNELTKYDACIRHYRVVIESWGEFAKIAKIRLVRDFVLGV